LKGKTEEVVDYAKETECEDDCNSGGSADVPVTKFV
jgi:hypothetical protein